MLFIGEFLPRLPEKAVKRSIILRSAEPASEAGFVALKGLAMSSSADRTSVVLL
jgi:hypothetical protein